jgi:diadenosine tetraphosphatase ApaH/serine/threonine PP2A family protein phosphatase
VHYAVISCIHGNLEALEAVLADAVSKGCEQVICLGDVVGLGPDPVECVDMVRRTCAVVLKGCHDEALVQGAAHLAAPVRASIEWHKEALGEEGQDRIDWLASLPYRYEAGGIQFVHGSPREPTQEYLFPDDVQKDARKLQRAFALVEKVLFAGHTHLPGVFTNEPLGFQTPTAVNGYFHYKRGTKVVVNVGSVGQPKDGDPRACWLEIQKNEMFWRRVEYDVETVVQKMKANARLAPAFGARLLRGI